MKGFFEIGIIQGKNSDNLGTLWRSANIMGASGIFTIGARYPKRHRTDTMNTPNNIPLREHDSQEGFLKSLPRGTALVAIELTKDAIPLTEFNHPKKAIYLLGAEDFGIPNELIDKCNSVIKIPFNKNSFNVAVAGSMVLYDRFLKANQERKSQKQFLKEKYNLKKSA